MGAVDKLRAQLLPNRDVRFRPPESSAAAPAADSGMWFNNPRYISPYGIQGGASPPDDVGGFAEGAFLASGQLWGRRRGPEPGSDRHRR